MHTTRRTLGGLLLSTLAAPPLLAQEDQALAYYRAAKVNWRQAEGQTLTIGLNKHPFTESLLPLIPQFRALTGIRIEYLILPEAEYFTKLVADLSQQRGEFSVIMTGPMRNWQYALPGWILPLDPFLADSRLTDAEWFRLNDVFPGLVAANRWNGETGSGVGQGSLYAIPVLSETYSMAYRKDIFDQHNIKVPTTLEEMVEAARQVKRAANIPGIVARGTPNVSAVATGFISGLKSYTDGQWAELDSNLRANLHDPRSVKYTESWIDMVRESGPPNWANMQWYDAMEAFTAGQAGMIADADFFAANYEDPTKSRVAGKVGYTLIPPGPAGKTYAGMWTWGLGMSKATRSREAAWLFIQWATAQRTLLNATINFRNYNPSRASIMEDARVKEIMGAWGGGAYVATMAKNLETARVAWIPQPERVRLGDIWARSLHEIYYRRMPAEAALRRASTEIDRVLREAGVTRR
ncbi:MAG: extracellular solute-binding protein [Acetobacteraceae bacterium]|nr:extracellular solute-binding protein [Acetobacteraceae bacterium]